MIREIRSYNNAHYYDEYDLYCDDGYKCQSSFLHGTESIVGTYLEGCGASSNFDYCDTVDGIIRGDE